MAYARDDIFVKAINGYAVAGAQVYVCTQPANTTNVPPSPLATLYGNSLGSLSLTNPLTTDGFGHAYFYADPTQLYTIVTVNNGTILEVLPDQALNAIGASTLRVATNGVANADQALLNLVNGTNISLVADSNGDVTISASSALTLETNGVSNSNQTLLNLAAGSGLSLVNSSGTTTITNTQPASALGTRVVFQTGFSDGGATTETSISITNAASGSGDQYTADYLYMDNTSGSNDIVQTTFGWNLYGNATFAALIKMDAIETNTSSPLYMAFQGSTSNLDPLTSGNLCGVLNIGGKANWQMFTTIAGSNTQQDSGLAVDTNPHKFQLIVNSGASTFSFWVDGVEISTMSYSGIANSTNMFMRAACYPVGTCTGKMRVSMIYGEAY